MRGRRTTPRDLRTLVTRLWPDPEHTGGSIVVTTDKLPSTHRLVEEYFILPNRKLPALLVPTAAPAAALEHFVTTKSAGAASMARAAGRPLSNRLAAARVPRLRVGVHEDAMTSAAPPTILQAVAGALDQQQLLACIPVRRDRPGAKPIMMAFDERAQRSWWVKVGWSPSTRTLVRREYDALEHLHGRLDRLAVPRPVATGAWRELTYSIAASVPPGTRPWSLAPEATPDVLAQLCATTPRKDSTLANSPYAARIGRSLEQACGAEAEVVRVLRRLVHTLEQRTEVLRFGRSHGDWVPWNLGASDANRMHAWDWENSHDDAPLGLDLLHWHFQTTLASRGKSLADAVRAVDAATPELRELGLPDSAHEVVASTYLLDMFTRGALLASEGAGWNSQLHAGLVEAARHRTSMLSAS